MKHNGKVIILAGMATLLISGCTRLAPQEAFEAVAYQVDERIGKRVQWDMGSDDDLAARAGVKSLLSRQLTPASAVQIALLNNRELQAAYADVGIAQADLVQAGLLRNPVFDGAVTWWNQAGGTPDLAFGIAWSFTDLLRRPKRKAVALSALEEAKLNVARKIIGHAADTHAAFITYVAAKQEVDLFRAVERSARATLKAATALRKAGNFTELQFEQNQGFLTSAKLDLAQSQARADEAREILNVLMGLTGSQTGWTSPDKLPDMMQGGPNTSNAERRAIRASLDIEMTRQRLTTMGREFRLIRKESLLPDVDTGADFDREVEIDTTEENGQQVKEKGFRRTFGPTFGIEIPIFDHGQARKAGALLKIRQAEDELWALAVRVRSSARLSVTRIRTAKKMVAYYHDAVLPQAERILKGTQRNYNAMQQSVFQLVAARRQQILAGRQFIEAQRAYWKATVRFQQLMSGSLPSGGDAGATEVASAPAGGGGGGGH